MSKLNDPPFDAIVSIENEISVQMAWRTHYSGRGDEQMVERIERDIRKLQAHVDRRLQERGLSPRYGSGAGNAVAWDGRL